MSMASFDSGAAISFDEWWKSASFHSQQYQRDQRRRNALSKLDKNLAEIRAGRSGQDH